MAKYIYRLLIICILSPFMAGGCLYSVMRIGFVLGKDFSDSMFGLVFEEE